MKKFKLSICLVLTMVLMFSFSTLSVFAADSKTVTVTVEKSFTCTGPQVSGYVQSIQQSTYSYSDGTYRGVLSYVRINSWRSVLVGKTSDNLDVYTFTLGVEYAGTVTRPEVTTSKSVTITDNKTFSCPGPQTGTYMQGIVNSTYNYDDGYYRGTLAFSKITNVKQTYIASSDYGDIYKYDVSVEYTGTVTSY